MDNLFINSSSSHHDSMSTSSDSSYGFHNHSMEPKINNVVATATLNCQLDLEHLCTCLRNAIYNPFKFPALNLSIKEPSHMNVKIFRNGKIIVTGAKKEEDTHEAVQMLVKAIRKVGYKDVKATDFRIQTLMATYDVGFRIDLLRLYQSPHRKFI